MSKKFLNKRLLIFAGKILIATGLFYWLLKQNRVDFSVISGLTLNLNTVAMLSIGAVLVSIALMIMACRLNILLLLQNVRRPIKQLFSLTLIGSLFGSVLPGVVSGDLVKVFYLCRYEPQKRSRTIAAVVADRVIGLYSLMLLGAISSSIAYLTKILPDSKHFFLLSFPIMFGVATILLFIINLCFTKALLERLPSKFTNLTDALVQYKKNFGHVLAAVVMSLISHGLIVISFFLVAKLIKDSLPMSMHFVINPLAMVMNAVPLTPGGIGIAESAFSFLYEWSGSPNGGNVGLIGRFVQYSVFFVGGITAFLCTRVPGQPMKWYSYKRILQKACYRSQN